MDCLQRLPASFLLFQLVINLAAPSANGASFRVATYNLENYLDQATESRQPKSIEAKTKIRESILAIKPDVIALQEMGTTNALMELRASLKAQGCDFPYWEHAAGYDTNIFIAVLSKFPFTARRSHTNESFLLHGRRFRVSRAFAEVDVSVNPKYSFTLMTAHLKSRRPVGIADEAELRLEEARVLRQKIDSALAAHPAMNLVVLGDFNDGKDSASTKAIIGRGKNHLIDTRPAERNGDNLPAAKVGYEPRNIAWTHYYGKEDTYSRIDFILLSEGMRHEWLPDETFVLALPNWGEGSDHRPIVASFSAEDK